MAMSRLSASTFDSRLSTLDFRLSIFLQPNGNRTVPEHRSHSKQRIFRFRSVISPFQLSIFDLCFPERRHPKREPRSSCLNFRLSTLDFRLLGMQARVANRKAGLPLRSLRSNIKNLLRALPPDNPSVNNYIL